MSTAPVTPEAITPVVETPTLEVTPPIVEVPEQVYHYQPTDESGRPLGGKQVIKYRNQDELTQKLTDQNVLLVRKLREETKKNRLGLNKPDEIPSEAQKLDEPMEFTPRQLTADERVKLSRDLLDPDKFEEASSALFEATVGASPTQLRKTLSALQVSDLRLRAKAESDAFLKQTPDYYPCQENFETVTNWMVKNNLSPVRDNFQLAYDTLKAAGLLLEAPIVREEAPAPTTPVVAVIEPTPANTQPVQDELGRITETSPAQAKRPAVPVPSGLTRNTTSEAGSHPTRKYTLAEIDAMSSEVYRKKLNEKGFRELYDELVAEKAQAKKR